VQWSQEQCIHFSVKIVHCSKGSKCEPDEDLTKVPCCAGRVRNGETKENPQSPPVKPTFPKIIWEKFLTKGEVT